MRAVAAAYGWSGDIADEIQPPEALRSRGQCPHPRTASTCADRLRTEPQARPRRGVREDDGCPVTSRRRRRSLPRAAAFRPTRTPRVSRTLVRHDWGRSFDHQVSGAMGCRRILTPMENDAEGDDDGTG